MVSHLLAAPSLRSSSNLSPSRKFLLTLAVLLTSDNPWRYLSDEPQAGLLTISPHTHMVQLTIDACMTPDVLLMNAFDGGYWLRIYTVYTYVYIITCYMPIYIYICV